MEKSRYQQPYDDSTPNVSAPLFRWNILLLFILAINLLCVPASYAWWSTGDLQSVHHRISNKAFSLVRPKLTNNFLLTNEIQIIKSTTSAPNDSEAHDGNPYRNGGPISTWFNNFKDAYNAGHGDEAAKWLGYCIHLIEDMNVPAHAYNIPHYNPSSLSDPIPNFDNFEASAYNYFINSINKEISEISYPNNNIAFFYYDGARKSTKDNVKIWNFSDYWIEGSGAQWCGGYGIAGCDDGPAGSYNTNNGDKFPSIFIIPYSYDFYFLQNQLTQAVDYVGMFLLGVDRILAAQSLNEDGYEENNTITSATPIQVPFYDATLKCNDDDWFKVWVQTEEKLEVTINFLNANGDLELYLYNSSGYLISSSESNSNSETITFGPSSINDYYYIKVHGWNGAKNSYSMTVKTYTTSSPDLRAKSMNNKSTVVTEGDSFWFSAYIYNSGLSSAAASHARLYLSTNGDNNTYYDYNLGDVSVSQLAPLTGQWVTWSFTMPNLSSGQYPVWGKVIVDSWGEVYEGIEDSGPFIRIGSNDFTAYDVRTLSGLTIIGSSTVNESSTAAYSAIASWSDGTTTTVTPIWSEINIYAAVSSGGLLTTAAVSGNKTFTLTASYTYGGVTKTTTQAVTIIDVTATLTGLTIYGPGSVVENNSAVYITTADWSNGTSNVITPTWSENSTYASINSSGVLTALTVPSDQNEVITTSYTFGGVTKTTTKQVTIVNIDSIPDAYSFTARTNAALSTMTTSNSITVSGINAATPISITGGSYSINGGAYTTSAGIVSNGNTVTARLTSSSSYSTTTNATLTIGGVSGTFGVTTKASSVDTTAPTITTYTLPVTSVGLTVPVTFNASDTIGVTGYCLTETNNSATCNWYMAPQASYTFNSTGVKTLYAFAKDAAGNVSAFKSASTTITASNPTVSTVSSTGGSFSPASRSVTNGSSTSFTVTPVPGYHITSVTGCNGTLSGTTYSLGSVTADCNVSAFFAKSDSTYNEDAYLAANPDIAAAVKAGWLSSGWQHYSNWGRNEGRPLTPSGYGFFTESGYLAANPDIAAAIKAGWLSNGWDHYSRWGNTEGRPMAPADYATFNEEAYLAANPDIAAAVKAGGLTSGWQHYSNWGRSENRPLIPATYGTFTEDGYLFANPDVSAFVKTGALNSGWEHYSNWGKHEGRPSNPSGYTVFSEAGYLTANPDVAAVVKTGVYSSGWDHYVLAGKHEGRLVVPADYATFDEKAYLAANPDIAAAVKAGWLTNGWTHYNAWGGMNEGRPLNSTTYGSFNEADYLAANPDLFQAVLSGVLPSGWYHYNNWGRNEGRMVRP